MLRRSPGDAGDLVRAWQPMAVQDAVMDGPPGVGYERRAGRAGRRRGRLSSHPTRRSSLAVCITYGMPLETREPDSSMAAGARFLRGRLYRQRMDRDGNAFLVVAVSVFYIASE